MNILEQIPAASAEEQEKMLGALLVEAEILANDEHAWSSLALGYFHARRFEEARDLYQQLVDAFPQRDVHRLNLATSLSQMGQLELCIRQLEHVRDEGHDESDMRDAAEMLEGLLEWLGRSQAQKQAADGRRAALHESITTGSAAPEEYVELARLYLRQRAQAGDLAEAEAATSSAREVLEQGERRFPEFTGILEHLALVYFQTQGAEDVLEVVLEKLQRIAPESPVLAACQTAAESDGEAFSERMRARAYELMRTCQSDDEKLVNAALQDLQKMVVTYAQSPEYRKTYAMALLMAGHKPEALREAEILESLEIDSHDMHFHLGQLFSLCGDPAKGLHYLEHALQSAPTEEDRKMTQELIDRLGQR